MSTKGTLESIKFVKSALNSLDLPTKEIVIPEKDWEMISVMPLAYGAYKSLDSSSTDESIGRGLGLAVITRELVRAGLMPEIDKSNEISLKLISSAVEDLKSDYEGVVTALSLHYPSQEELLFASLESKFGKGVVSALYIYHAWAVELLGEEYSSNEILVEALNPFPKKSAEAFEDEEDLIDDTPVDGQAASELISRLAELSTIPGVKFRFDVVKDIPSILVWLPEACEVDSLIEAQTILGPCRLNVENNVICLVSTL